jgi:hypothetical protein
MPTPTLDDSSQQLAIAVDPSYASMFDQGLGEIDLKELLAKNETIFINLPCSTISDNLALIIIKLLMNDTHQKPEKQA